MKKILSLTKKLLLALAEGYADLLATHQHYRSLSRVMYPDYYKAKERDRSERERRRALYALRESKMIAIRKKGDQILFALTEKGRQWVLQQRASHAALCPKGECIIVIFDIPESQRVVRDQLRYFLAEHHFQQLQKSVWMSNREILSLLEEFVLDSGAKPWVHAFRAKGITL